MDPLINLLRWSVTTTLERLPSYLAHYVTDQNYPKYTPRDHAAWRYIMHRGLPYYRQHAVSVYEEGLSKTGLPLDRIPTIAGMDQALQKFGWGAVGVCGFIPPWAFLEFQSLRVLPIATDMRSVDHIGYTPAPDIVHEAAGHAPILIDKDYREYLESYAQACCKAIYSRQDNKLFEAIRVLSDIKEKPGTPIAEIKAAEANLEKAKHAFTYVSEQARVARMSWWTNEYGLVGSLENPKIFGAGLLSSVAESQALFGDHVKKIRLSLACTEQSYDITEPQPQLYVARDMTHLLEVLEELKATLAYRIGGLVAMQRALESQAVTTTVLDSGLAVSGILAGYSAHEASGQVDFARWQGPVQISQNQQELPQQGNARHPDGFSCPIGPWQNHSDPSHITADQCQQWGWRTGHEATIKFKSGFVVSGKLAAIDFGADKLVRYLTFDQARVVRGEDVFYKPEWGLFDMPVATNINHTYGGPADRQAYGEHEIPEITTVPNGGQNHETDHATLMKLYQDLRDLRQQSQPAPSKLQVLADKLQQQHPKEWLAQLETLELAKKHWHLTPKDHPWLTAIEQNLASQAFNADTRQAIDAGRFIWDAS